MTGRAGRATVPAVAVAVVVVVAAVAGLVLGSAAPAAAHVSLLASSPAQGERLGALPATVRLEFSEPLSAPAYVVVTGPDGAAVVAGEVVVDDRVVSAPLADGAPDGTYLLAFRVVSEDGHPVSGRIAFVVGDGPLEQPVPGGAEGSGPRAPAEPGTTASPVGGGADGSGRPTLAQVQVAVGGALFAAALALLVASRSRPRRLSRRA